MKTTRLLAGLTIHEHSCQVVKI